MSIYSVLGEMLPGVKNRWGELSLWGLSQAGGIVIGGNGTGGEYH